MAMIVDEFGGNYLDYEYNPENKLKINKKESEDD